MQGQDSAEMPSGMELSRQSCSNVLPAEMSASEKTDGADEYYLNLAGNLDESLEVEKVQKNLPSSKNGSVHEASLEIPHDTSAVETSSTWGDFEAFSEAKLRNVSDTPESLQKLSEKQVYMNGVDLNHNCTTTSWTQFFSQTARHNGRETSTNVKAVSSVEDIIKLSFPAIPIPQLLEKISSLEQVLRTKTDNTEDSECTEQQLCDSANLWKTFTQCNNLSSFGCPWNESRNQENLLAVLGIDVHQKALPEGENEILEEMKVEENEDSSADKCNISMCKALIQTKLSVSPDARQSHLFTYNLFLKKTPSTGNMQYITVPQKKRIFTTQSLRMKLFSSNVC
ncbi:uncharacterized protein CLBA1 isoform X2 [Sceloporus undulatus]|uniref:uncharacterized protein CLBA1 isoform X2 n=1 Tax=Sceloporus undulatus TaxID=8520 RepID=UPI001C4B2231|nr:uncharacterized protein CLBA1 isoform X2 [Sceloporus undulatus]